MGYASDDMYLGFHPPPCTKTFTAFDLKNGFSHALAVGTEEECKRGQLRPTADVVFRGMKPYVVGGKYRLALRLGVGFGCEYYYGTNIQTGEEGVVELKLVVGIRCNGSIRTHTAELAVNSDHARFWSDPQDHKDGRILTPFGLVDWEYIVSSPLFNPAVPGAMPPLDGGLLSKDAVSWYSLKEQTIQETVRHYLPDFKHAPFDEALYFAPGNYLQPSTRSISLIADVGQNYSPRAPESVVDPFVFATFHPEFRADLFSNGKPRSDWEFMKYLEECCREGPPRVFPKVGDG